MSWQSVDWASKLRTQPVAKLLALHLCLKHGSGAVRLNVHEAAVWCGTEPALILRALEQIPEITWKAAGDYEFLVRLPEDDQSGFGRSQVYKESSK